MSNMNGKIVDRRSTRSLYSRNSTAADEEIQDNKALDSIKPETENASEERILPSSIQDEGKVETSETFENTDGNEYKKQIENIPDNTQVMSPNISLDTKLSTSKIQREKKDYKKKTTKAGITDREWLGSMEHKHKWTALDAKRGMCNDCKKVFSSRQVCENKFQHYKFYMKSHKRLNAI